MEPLKIELTLTKSTKGTHVYGDDREGAPIPTLYIKRAALPSPPPEKITITVGAK